MFVTTIAHNTYNLQGSDYENKILKTRMTEIF